MAVSVLTPGWFAAFSIEHRELRNHSRNLVGNRGDEILLLSPFLLF